METGTNIGKLSKADKWKKQNFMERLSFVKYWAEYVKSHDDKLWSKAQKNLIDWQFEHARRFYEYLSKTKEGKETIKRLREFHVNR